MTSRRALLGSLLFALLTVGVLTGCGSDNTQVTPAADDVQPTSEEPPSEEEETLPEEGP